MPLYTLINTKTGERIEHYAPMAQAPSSPCVIDGVEYVRDYAADTPGTCVKQHGVKFPDPAGLPTSRTLPTVTTKGKVVRRQGHTVLRHDDGLYTTLKGRPIIGNKRDEDVAARRFNMTKG